MAVILENLKLNDVFPNYTADGGIFAGLQNFGVPWRNESAAQYFGMVFHANRAGNKYISPMVIQWLDENGEFVNVGISRISQAIYRIYNPGWLKEWATREFTYTPLSNYDMTETMTNDRTVDEVDVTVTRDNGVYGFNSTVEVPAAGESARTKSAANGNTRTRNYTLTRSGNIGVTTSQQMLQAERDAWLWNFFNDVVYPDLERELTIDIY